jgi:serine/threonine protein kinase
MKRQKRAPESCPHPRPHPLTTPSLSALPLPLKITREVKIHRKLQHPYIVRLEDYVEDSDSVIILLECCRSDVRYFSVSLSVSLSICCLTSHLPPFPSR